MGPPVLESCAHLGNNHSGGWGPSYVLILHPRAWLVPQTTYMEGGVPEENQRMCLKKERGGKGLLTGPVQLPNPTSHNVGTRIQT